MTINYDIGELSTISKNWLKRPYRGSKGESTVGRRWGGLATYDLGVYLDEARSGAVSTADYIQGVDRTAVRDNLAAYASNLASHLRANLPAATLDDVVGGMVIEPHDGTTLRQTSLPYQDASVSLEEWTGDIPLAYKPSLRVQYQHQRGLHLRRDLRQAPDH